MPRRPPRPPFDDARDGLCRLCGGIVLGRGSKARWHLECLREYEPVSEPAQLRRAAYLASGGRCAQCGVGHEAAAATWEADHREPLWRADGDIRFWLRSNLQVLCKHPCHDTKTRKDAADYRAARSRMKRTG